MKKSIFLEGLFLLFLCTACFSQSKTIRKLQLDFERVEINGAGQKNAISGNLYYKNNPYFFVFNILKPENQVNYINSDGTFFKDSTGIYDFTQGRSILNQTCVDILTWFKSDMGLGDSGYAPAISTVEDGLVVTEWQYFRNGAHAIEKVLVTTDSKGNFTNLKMYLASGELYTETKLSDFTKITGYTVPTTIESQTYTNGKPYICTILKFSKIKINQIEDAYSEYQAENSSPAKSNEINGIKNPVVLAISPLSPVFRVSLSSVITNIAYKGYKKFVTKQDNSACPFEPTCSQYMLQAISKYGPAGLIMGLERLKRCNPTEHNANLYDTNKNGKHVDPVK